MALVLGTNCGFVTTAPTADPWGSDTYLADKYARALRDVAPSGAIKITEIGWWCDSTTEESNFEVGVYSDNSETQQPLNLLAGASQTNAKGTTSGWKKATVNITITEGTTYWIAFQLDDTTNTTVDNEQTGTAGRRAYYPNATT